MLSAGKGAGGVSMNFFSTVVRIVGLTMSSVLLAALPAESQNAPPAQSPPAAQPPSTPPATRPVPAEPSTLPPDPGERSKSAPEELGQRQKVEGVVQSVDGTTMQLKSDAGRIVVVDLSRVSTRVHEIAPKGESVTVIGVIAPGSDRLVAQAVIGNLKPDREAPAAPPHAR
jgi:hypothetical protein